jgi:hypothetical protein
MGLMLLALIAAIAVWLVTREPTRMDIPAMVSRIIDSPRWLIHM